MHAPPDLPPITPLLESLIEIQAFDRIPRLGFLQRGIASPESVCEHSWHVAFLVSRLGRYVPGLDRLQAIEFALEHDLAELKTGDLPQPVAHLLPTGAKDQLEATVLAQLLAPLGGTTPDGPVGQLEQSFVKSCDRLHLAIKAAAYERAGWRGAEELLHAALKSLRRRQDEPFAVVTALVAELERREPGATLSAHVDD